MNVEEVPKEKLKKAWDTDFKVSVEPEGLPAVKGYNFAEKFDFDRFLESYGTTGFQATNLWKAVEIIRKMRKDKVRIFLAYNSNMVSSGLREVIAYLVKRHYVDALITTAGGVEEDIIKTINQFLVGDFRKIDGKTLRRDGINRIGNIYVPNDRYIEFERLMNDFLQKLYERQKETGKIITTSEFIHELGKEVNDEESIYYWATRNNVPVFCPALTDGSIGDMIYFFKQMKKENMDFKVDISDDMVKLVNMVINAEKTGVIVLGGGFVKHHIMGANLFRDGAEYAVYVSLENEEGGSDSQARPDEARSWGKIKADGEAVKVYADATIVFPLIVAAAFKD